MTQATDVYGWGKTALEIISGRQPSRKIAPANIIKVVMLDKELPKAEDHLCSVFRAHPSLWPLLESCWDRDPTRRPTVEFILERLSAFLGIFQHSSTSRTTR